jgi:predicted heme/steroid binding protein
MRYYDSKICRRIKTAILESKKYINFIYETPCAYTRNMLLNQLSEKINEIDFLSDMICCQIKQEQVGSILLPQQSPRNLTISELTKFNGRDGKPAYVAVNGTIYDVTNNAAWAAATHFGLNAGKDLTDEFASCHANQTILSKLKIVGKLIE